jgi:spore maturation protein CgeB
VSVSRPRIALLDKAGGVLSWQDDLAEGFRASGADVSCLNIRPASFREYRAKWRQRVRALENPEICARLAAGLRDFAPDLVVVLNQPGLPPMTEAMWRDALRPGVPLVGWLCDHLNAFPASFAPNLDGVYFFDSATLPVLRAAYAGPGARVGARLAPLPLAASPARYAVLDKPFRDRRRSLVFAGKNTPERRRSIEAYRALGGELEAYGPGSDNPWRPWRKRRLDATALARLYTGHFAAFNLLQPKNTVHGLNLRAFEIPAAGGLSTYPLTPDLSAAFVPGEEVIAYTDMPDLKRQMDLLYAEPERAERVATAGHARVRREHTFAHRAQRMLKDWLA